MMVGAGGADADANANADADATSSRFGSKSEEEETAAAAAEEEDVDVTLSGQASNLPMRTAASLSRDGDDELDCHRRLTPGGFFFVGDFCCCRRPGSGRQWTDEAVSEAKNSI